MYEPITSKNQYRRELLDLTPKKVQTGTQIPESQSSEILPTYGMSSEQRANRKTQESLWDLQKSDEQAAITQLRDSGGFFPDETAFSTYETPVPPDYQKPKTVSGQDEQDAINKLKGGGPFFPNQSYAKGGDFITNGPQEILVGDNPGGHERVTIKPLSSKNDAKFGRYGDDAMKIIDGQPAHIDSSIEGDMSQEDIKKYGAGTINPITGKKEYFLPLAAGLLAIGSSLYKGFSAQGNKADVAAGKQAAGDIYQEQVGMYGEQKDLTTQAIENQFTGASRDIRFGLEAGQEDIAYATGKTNLPTSGTLKTQEEDLLEKAKSDITKLVETRDLSRTEADLSYRKGEMSAEDAYQNTLTGLESVQTGFWEGFFG
jgi:hypothetical protein